MSIAKFLCLTIFIIKQTSLGQQTSYHHYNRQKGIESTYDNETLTTGDEESQMCHLSVRCPNIASLGELLALISSIEQIHHVLF